MTCRAQRGKGEAVHDAQTADGHHSRHPPTRRNAYLPPTAPRVWAPRARNCPGRRTGTFADSDTPKLTPASTKRPSRAESPVLEENPDVGEPA
ncbi:hypothetical protein G3N56_11640 [Desulfovibrio sulfodismutans]|uniref:Uncharacterized protein n=1 Tax=Desulfolutivibrio sulfodismutans TaxID=63561 RepID=A0A7K3NNI7_9BACT|nr:hypothetical protein [Desulfolutivibrio sulfodismutans]NDY57393.1 hypothetical protein [Desulfolutivibrio sulfodismutans]QLA12908.1 hypothetical protein GD606_11800 [Desulfolutivibrio sulfodismutans DSM 3696]